MSLFSLRKSTPSSPDLDSMAAGAKTATSAPSHHPLDVLTGGAFSAPTSGERAARVRAWLQTDPSWDVMNEVFKDLSQRDRGAALSLIHI